MRKYLPFILASLLFSSTVFAQETPPPVAPPAPSRLTITAIPPRVELEALPGVTLQETLKVRNESETEMAVSVIGVDFIVLDDQGTPVAVDEAVSGRWSLASWLTATPKKLLLQPQQTGQINLVIDIPQNALPGGHYAMVTYQPITEATLARGAQGIGGGAQIIPKVGSLIYLNVIGDVTEAGHLKEFKTDAYFRHYGPINLFAEIENLGDVHLRPTGTVTVANMLGDEIWAAELEEKNIFPFASRTYEWEVSGKWRLGRYAARFEAVAGGSQLPINGLIYFWIVPVKELSLVAGAIILIAILIILKKKKKAPPVPLADIPQEEPIMT